MIRQRFSMGVMGFLALGWASVPASAGGPDDASGPALFPAPSFPVEGPSLTGNSASPSPGPTLSSRPTQSSPTARPTANLWHRAAACPPVPPRQQPLAPSSPPTADRSGWTAASRPAKPTGLAPSALPTHLPSVVETAGPVLSPPIQPAQPPQKMLPNRARGTVKSAPRFEAPAVAKPFAPPPPPSEPMPTTSARIVTVPTDGVSPSLPPSVVAGQAAGLPSGQLAPTAPLMAMPLAIDSAMPQPMNVMPLTVVDFSPSTVSAVSGPIEFPATSPVAITPVSAPVNTPAPPPAPPIVPAAPVSTTVESSSHLAMMRPLVGPEPDSDWLEAPRVVCDKAFDCYDQFAGQGGQFTANVGFMLLVPKWGNNPAFASATLGGPVLHSQQNDFDDGAQVAPRIYLGFVNGDGLGFRVGWWGFGIGDGQASIAGTPAVSAAPLGLQADTLGAGSARTLATGSHLQLNVWDFEATENFQYGAWSLLGTAGLRYAHLGEGYLASVYGAGGANLQNLTSGHNFNGIGPTVSFGGKRHLGNTPLYFYGTTRGSMLFGGSNASATLAGPDVTVPAASSASLDSIVPVAEIELGFGYYRSILQGARAFAEAGVIAQSWFNAGNPSGSFVPPGTPFNSTFAPTSGTLGLIGLSVRCGVNF